MDKKMYKHSISQNDNQKNNKKTKEIKLLVNYIPVKKTHVQSNISEYETEQSIQRNFTNKCQKNKLNSHPKSVQTTHSNPNKYSPKKLQSKKTTKKNFSNVNKPCRGSFYNLNNLNIYDYFSEKVVLTQKKFIDYKNNKIDVLKNELQLIKKEINVYEKNNSNSNNNSKTNKSNASNSSSNSGNINKNKNHIIPKVLYVNKNNNKYLLVNNNNSYVSLSPFLGNNNKIFDNEDTADKKLEKHLSNFLTENNSENNLKYKNNFNDINNENTKRLLSIMYQSKKGCFNHNNYNYDHNINIKDIIKDNNQVKSKENALMNNHQLDNEIKHNLYFCTNKINDNQIIQVKENINNKTNTLNIELEFKKINEKVNKVFSYLFDYHNKNNLNKKCQKNIK